MALILGWQGGRWKGESEKHCRACIYPPLPLSYIHISVISFPIVQYFLGDDTPVYIHEKEFWRAGVERGVEKCKGLTHGAYLRNRQSPCFGKFKDTQDKVLPNSSICVFLLFLFSFATAPKRLPAIVTYV